MNRPLRVKPCTHDSNGPSLNDGSAYQKKEVGLEGSQLGIKVEDVVQLSNKQVMLDGPILADGSECEKSLDGLKVTKNGGLGTSNGNLANNSNLVKNGQVFVPSDGSCKQTDANGSKSSWASLFGSSSSNPLSYTPPKIVGDKIVVVPPEEVIVQGVRV